MKYVLYNPNSNRGKAVEYAKQIAKEIEGDLRDATGINYKQFLTNLGDQDEVYLVGGDGTISRLINELDNADVSAKLFFCAAGTGNDFATDINYGKAESEIQKYIPLNDYIKDLPTVTVNGITKRFINGIGFGLDGMCCEIGDEMRAKNAKNINYASIAIKQMLFSFKKKTATVTVDGKETVYKDVFIAPSMKGRFYGGGMLVAPNQNRLSEDKTLTSVIFRGKSRLGTLMVFPKIFKGEHIKYPKHVSIASGKEITVEFNEPTALQVDGETIKNVKSYTVRV